MKAFPPVCVNCSVPELRGSLWCLQQARAPRVCAAQMVPGCAEEQSSAFPCRLGDAHAHMAAGHGATSSAGMLGGALTAVQCREGMLSVLMPSSLLAGVYAKHTSPRTIWFLQHTCCGRRCSGRGRRCRFLCARSIWARGVCRRLAGGSAPSAHVHTLCCGLFADFNLLAVSFSRLLERRCFLASGGEAVVAPAVVW